MCPCICHRVVYLQQLVNYSLLWTFISLKERKFAIPFPYPLYAVQPLKCGNKCLLYL